MCNVHLGVNHLQVYNHVSYECNVLSWVAVSDRSSILVAQYHKCIISEVYVPEDETVLQVLCLWREDSSEYSRRNYRLCVHPL
ncbi:hypothetical protein CEXT_733061 [Caerostris extrusa]|uniref:Uncharacterized protein n=1 Tax=Caerostris extrusa TaxID=172846 RepID=A0AAV4QX51_CAEEX|nr:hypothetical protein CEXT_733061 [Caerostris extrusa]